MLASGVGDERQSARECTNGEKAGPIAAREVPVGIPIGQPAAPQQRVSPERGERRSRALW
jgi:hypothetical protein